MTILQIDRSKPFDFVAFVGNDWSKDGEVGKGWSIVEEDERSLVLTEVDLTQISFVTMLERDECYIVGEEKLKRLKAQGCIRLDAKVFQTLFENQHLIPEAWKEVNDDSPPYIIFDGTVIQGGSIRNVLCLYWEHGEWDWGLHWLDGECNDPSAVLAS